MKKHCLLMAALVLGTTLGARAQKGTEAFREKFLNPPAAYRPAPLNVWNGILSDAESVRMMKALDDKGFGAAFIHPRPGLITPYMSPAWMSAFGKAIDYGRKNDMYVWIYDENSYPSGFGGGMVPEQMPESYNEGVGLAEETAATLPDNAGDYFLCLVQDGEGWLDITARLDAYKGKKANYKLYRKTFYGRSPWYGGYSYVDLLKKGVTEKFIETTMDKYKKAFGAEFGKVIPGVFSDEPNIMPPGGIRWTPELFSVFRQRW